LSASDRVAVTVSREHRYDRPERQIDDALDDMIRMGVRALLVVRISASWASSPRDIQGERPLQFLQSSTYTHHRDIRVTHIMTPWQC
jgi:hypothetical protein